MYIIIIYKPCGRGKKIKKRKKNARII